ncbi:DUF1704 domain-containing protein [Candidatus Saccharibacteria bacterium]|nr:DUF1704 domain-containing protein [Candidatus Saccharibacteria bacterium]
MKNSEQYHSSSNNEEIKTDKTPPNDSTEFNWELHKKDIKNITEPIVEGIPDDDYEYILHSWEISPTVGNQALVSIMSEAMSIQLPTIIENNSIDSIGGYVFGRNQIVLNRAALKENLHEIEEEDKMAEHELGTIAHELCTHAYRALVYEEHPIAAFSHELPGNEEIDEGIAKCCEQAVAGKYSDSGIEHYINIGLANFKGKNFREIFEIQQKLLYLQKCKPDETPEAKAARFHEKDSAIFSRTTRCFRGTGELPNNKDLVYYNGANRVWKYIEDHIDDPDLLDSLFLSGKSDIFDPDQRRLVYESKVGKI